MRELDLLDEQLLSIEQLRIVVAIVLGCALTSLPRPAEDWIGFTTAVQTQLSDQPQVWSPQRMSYQPAINMDRLSRAYSSYSGATTPPTWTLSTISNSKELLIVLHPQNLILIVAGGGGGENRLGR